uniref:NAD-dependent epimerase/dehydratase domain-containing protein n=2 Tax=Lotharella globosa TaxID=91324 RepID=A0A7S3Y885_9EUKA
MGGHKEEGINCNDAKMITPDTDPFPGTKADVPSKIDSTPYACAKLYGERLARSLGKLTGGRTSFVCLRIGWCRDGANLPSTLSYAGGAEEITDAQEKYITKMRGTSTTNDPHKLSDWYQLMWLSNRDLLQVCNCAMKAESKQGFTIVNAMSKNSGSRWDVSFGLDSIGYSPQDDVTEHARPDGDLNLSVRKPQLFVGSKL